MNDLPSASQMWRHANCSGNRMLIRSLFKAGYLTKDEPPSEDATIGQRIHAALEGDADLRLTFTEDEIKHDCDRLAYLCAKRFAGPGTWEQAHREQRFDYWIGTREPTFFTGKPDYVQFFDGGRRVIDINYKTGRKESVESALNLQLRTEVVLIWRHYRPEQIGAAIVEPLVSKQPVIVIYEEKELIKAEEEILKIVEKTETDSTRNAGAWCIHCPAKAFCSEAKALALANPINLDVAHALPVLPVGEEGAITLERIHIAKKLLDEYLMHYKHLVEENFNVIPGWHISQGKEVRSIDAGAAILAEPDAKELAKYTMSVTKLEELMKKKWGISGKAFRKRFSEKFRDAITTSITKGSLQKIPKELR